MLRGGYLQPSGMRTPVHRACASARSTNRQSALISRICSMVRARDSRSSGLATTKARHIARDTATFRRFREHGPQHEGGFPHVELRAAFSMLCRRSFTDSPEAGKADPVTGLFFGVQAYLEELNRLAKDTA